MAYHPISITRHAHSHSAPQLATPPNPLQTADCLVRWDPTQAIGTQSSPTSPAVSIRPIPPMGHAGGRLGIETGRIPPKTCGKTKKKLNRTKSIGPLVGRSPSKMTNPCKLFWVV